MSVDYKLLADNDLGGDLDAAFATMSAETITSTPEVMVTYRRISAAVSLEASATLEAIVQGMETMPSWVDKALATDGIDVNNPQVAGLLDSIIPEFSAAIIAMGIVTTPRYAGLKIGHLANARQKKEQAIAEAELLAALAQEQEALDASEA